LLFFTLGYIYGGTAFSIARVAWSEVTEKARPSLEDFKDHLKDVSIPSGS
jgi:hypothetical protein